MWGRTFNRGFHAYRNRYPYEVGYGVAGVGRGRGGLGRGLCAYLLELELVKEGKISQEEEKKILLDNIDFLKKEIQRLESRLNKISEGVE
ncbi:MAG: DUF5320 family protein [Methanofastidiosum sp.]|jgi:hypothetical protein|nr:DUF5320 family protein [Methanofastidiosum sp.]